MSSFFDAYAAIASSGGFDARFYLATYPEVAQTHSDPLVHYIECGAEERRVPHPEFDIDYYYEQCALAGEHPANPLLHFITIGAARGYRPQRDQEAVETQSLDHLSAGELLDSLKMFIDSPQVVDGRAVSPVRGSLSIRGWAVARSGVDAIDVAVDGVHVTSAHYGSKRIDVWRALPDWPDALHCGFTAIAPARALPAGGRVVRSLCATGMVRRQRRISTLRPWAAPTPTDPRRCGKRCRRWKSDFSIAVSPNWTGSLFSFSS